MNAFYHKIDELCIKNKITHRKLAEKIGVNEVTLSRYLTGERKLQLMPFMSMCKTLKIDPNALYKIYLFARMEERVAKYRTEKEKGATNGLYMDKDN